MEEKEIKSAFDLFKKAYITKRKLNNYKADSLLLEATKSWGTLTDEEKQIFVKKFNECQIKRRNKFGEHLKQTQPFLKKKTCLRRKRIHSNDSDSRNLCSAPYEDNPYTTEETSQLANLGFDDERLQSAVFADNTEIDRSSKEDEYPTPILTEPIPLQVKNARELFEQIKSRVGAGNVSWSSLPNIHKKYYQKAVYQLKKEYITNYKTYLENLSPKELFEYYHTFTLNK